MSLVNQNGFRNFLPTIHHGPIYSKDYDSDGALWIPLGAGGVQFNNFGGGTLTQTRTAGGNYNLVMTAAAASPILVIELNQPFEKLGSDPMFTAPNMPGGYTTNPPLPANAPGFVAPATGVGPIKVIDEYEGHLIRGFMLTSYDVVFTLGVANLTTFTGTIFETTLTAGTPAPVVVTKDAAQNIPNAFGANIQESNIKLATPFVIGSNASAAGSVDVMDFLEVNITNPGTSTLVLYGIRFYFDYCLF